MSRSNLPYMRTVSATRCSICGMERVSTAIAVAVPLCNSVISRATVLMVEDGELGGGGNGVDGSCGFEVDLAATTTGYVSTYYLGTCICSW